MKRVYLLRHAKSSWKVRGVPDHDRPLAPRGRRAAKAIAGHLLEQGIEPELVLCSTALRARQTLERIEPVLGTPVVRFEPEFYRATAGTLLARLRAVDDAVDSLLLTGHNPPCSSSRSSSLSQRVSCASSRRSSRPRGSRRWCFPAPAGERLHQTVRISPSSCDRATSRDRY
jgi:phosphohistidine phosphatase SixA